MSRPYFAQKLRQHRRGLDLTQAAMADLLGMLSPSYAPYEQGKKYPAEKFQKPMAEILGISLERLQAWIVIDRYGEEVAKAVCQELKAS